MASQPIAVVPLTPQLVPLILPVQEACYPAELLEGEESFTVKVLSSPGTSFVCMEPSSSSAWEASATDDDAASVSASFTADSAGRAVGYLVALETTRFNAPAIGSTADPASTSSAGVQADTLYLHDMAILPERQGKGVAKQLLGLAEKRRSELELDRLALIAVKGAHTYWERNGFAEVPTPLLPEPLQQKLLAYGEGARYMERTA